MIDGRGDSEAASLTCSSKSTMRGPFGVAGLLLPGEISVDIDRCWRRHNVYRDISFEDCDERATTRRGIMVSLPSPAFSHPLSRCFYEVRLKKKPKIRRAKLGMPTSPQHIPGRPDHRLR